MRLVKIVLVLAVISSILTAQEKQPANPDSGLGSVRGAVLQADTGTPLRNVHITINSSWETRDPESGEEDETASSAATSDEKGTFVFEHLKPGTYQLIASRTGMVQKSTGVGGSITVQVKSRAAERVTLFMVAAGVITGTVINEQGEPMENVRVTALRSRYSLMRRGLMPEQNTTTNDKGEYRLFA